jgi:pimeloyl-ACP methyl ester carboxylesterase
LNDYSFFSAPQLKRDPLGRAIALRKVRYSKRSRGVRLLVLILAVMPLSISTAASAQIPPSSPPISAPGQLVDIGGWRVHLNCTGQVSESQPTVILEAGAGDFSVEWSLVQPGVARFARVCSYDRAGMGWSDLGPRPRTMHQIVYELHTLLDRGGVRPPLVLVGHSYGGWLVRLYASTYPIDVAGLVLVEPGVDDPWRRIGNAPLRRSSELASGQPIPAVQASNPLRDSDIPPRIRSQIEAQASWFGPHANDPPRDKLPADAQRMRTWSLSQVKHHITNDNPFEAEELAGLRAERAKSEHPYGDIPLVVLTRGLTDEGGADTTAGAEEHRNDHAGLAKLSRNGRQIIATRSGHHVQLDEPELVIQTIREVLAVTRR